MATRLRTTTTADELLRMPRDGVRRELVRGELREMTPAGFKHGLIAGRIHESLGAHVRSRGLGVVAAAETGYRLSSHPDTVRAPDVSVVRRERVEQAGDPEGYFPGAPDLAVEVVSPSDRYGDVEEKVMDWLAAGTRMVVVVHPSRRAVTAYRSRSDIVLLTEDDVLDGGDVVPGWSIPVRDVFA